MNKEEKINNKNLEKIIYNKIKIFINEVLNKNNLINYYNKFEI